MGEAKVIPSLLDLSTRISSFKGIYGAIVLAAKRGPIGVPTLVTNESQLLSRYTPNDKIEVGYDNAYFSARAFLYKSNKLWTIRAAGAGYLYGNLEVVKSTASSISAPSNTTGTTEFATATFTVPTANQIIVLGGMTYTAGATVTVTAPQLAAAFAAGIAVPSLGGGALTITDAPTVAAWTRTQGTASNTHIVTFTSVTPNAPVSDLVKSGTGASAVTLAVTQGVAGTVVGVEVPDDYTFSADGLFLITGADQGAWNNDLKIGIIVDQAIVKMVGGFNINVYKGNTLLKTYTVSRTPGAKDGYGQNAYIEDVLLQSPYIRAVDNVTIPSDVLPKANVIPISLGGGNDGATVTDSDLVNAYDAITDKERYPCTLILDGGHSMVTVHQKILALAIARIDCFGILSTPYAAEVSESYLDDVVSYKQVTLNQSTPYGAIYSSHVKINDIYNNRVIEVSPDGYVAALFSQTALNDALYYPVAGDTRGNMTGLQVLDITRNYTEGERDYLYDNGINPIRFKRGKGIVLWGQKTLYGIPSALDRINVIMLLIIIRPAIVEYLETQLFNLNTLTNDKGTRFMIKTRINAFMDGFVGEGVYGYRVVCDDTNNSSEDIDNYILNVWLFIKPTKDIEEIPFKTIITPTGISFDLAQSLI